VGRVAPGGPMWQKNAGLSVSGDGPARVLGFGRKKTVVRTRGPLFFHWDGRLHGKLTPPGRTAEGVWGDSSDAPRKFNQIEFVSNLRQACCHARAHYVVVEGRATTRGTLHGSMYRAMTYDTTVGRCLSIRSEVGCPQVHQYVL